MGCGCGTPNNRAKWGISILLFVAGWICWVVDTPVYFGTIAAHNPKEFVGCAECLQDFVVETLKSVNATDIAHKIEKHEDEKREDDCLTHKEFKEIAEDFKDAHFPNWKQECKDECTPVMKTIPLAATYAGILFFIGTLCFIASAIPLCILCCAGEEKQRPLLYSAPVGAATSQAVESHQPTYDEASKPLLSSHA